MVIEGPFDCAVPNDLLANHLRRFGRRMHDHFHPICWQRLQLSSPAVHIVQHR